MYTPFQDTTSGESDEVLVAKARASDREALDELIARHHSWVFNIALRMLYHHADAEDATQEILLKALKALPSFRGESKFSTWLYRIAVNHILNVKKGRWTASEAICSFSDAARGLQRVPDLDPPDPATLPVPVEILIEEVKTECITGTLLCLDGRQRLIFILGVVFGVGDDVGSEIARVTPANFRQILSRARRDLYEYLRGNCSLLNADAACQCARKTRAYIQGGIVDPKNLRFTARHLRRVRDIVEEQPDESLEAYVNAVIDLYRSQPFCEAPDHAAQLQRAMRELSPSS